jgi:hypothetical protein
MNLEDKLQKCIDIAKSIHFTDEYLLEELAELEHRQWMAWSQNIAANDIISVKRLMKWQSLWVPYSQLSEEDKERDRSWAREVLAIIDRCKKE